MVRCRSDVLSWVFTSIMDPDIRKSCSSPNGPRHDRTASKGSSRDRSMSRSTRSSPTSPMIIDWFRRSSCALLSNPCQRRSRWRVIFNPAALSRLANCAVPSIRSAQRARNMSNCADSSSVSTSLQRASPMRNVCRSMLASLGRVDDFGAFTSASRQNTYLPRTSLAKR